MACAGIMVMTCMIALVTPELIGAAENNQIEANCSVSSSTVNEGQPVIITCAFSKKLTNEPFELRFKPAGQSEQLRVVYCKKSSSASSYNCSTEPGFSIDSTEITDTVRIRIFSAVKSQEGNYSCDVPNVKVRGICELTITEVPYAAKCTDRLTPWHQSTDVIFYFNKPAATHFSITRQPFSDKKYEQVVNCTGHDNTACAVDDRYVFVKPSDSTVLILRIKSLSQREEGIYNILIYSHLPAESMPCHLLGQDAEQKECNKGESTYALATLIFVILVFIILLIALAYVIYKKCRNTQTSLN